MRGVVLDKSFLVGCQATELAGLGRRLALFMPDVLVRELNSTDPESRQWCYAKLPTKVNPVVVIPNVGTLLRYEIENRRPCTPIYQRREQVAFRFNPKLAAGTFEYKGEVQAAREEDRRQAEADAREMVNRLAYVPPFFGDLLVDPVKDRGKFVEAAAESITTDPRRVTDIYARLREHEEHTAAPPATMLDPGWAFYRWVQVLVLSALWLWDKYPTGLPKDAGEPFWKRMEHNIQDIEYATLGALEGRIATRDDFVARLTTTMNPSTCIHR